MPAADGVPGERGPPSLSLLGLRVEAADEAADEVADRADLLVGALCDLTEVAHGLRTLHVPGAPHNYITVFCGSSLAIIRPEAVSLDRSCPLCGVRAVSSSSYRINIQ